MTQNRLTNFVLNEAALALDALSAAVSHYGSNVTEKGLPHPQQGALDLAEAAQKSLANMDAALSKEPFIGWCPVCEAPRISLPAPAEGTCSHCNNHLMTIRDPYADVNRIERLEEKLAAVKAQ